MTNDDWALFFVIFLVGVFAWSSGATHELNKARKRREEHERQRAEWRREIDMPSPEKPRHD